jgi:para-nitrobenzyl esterase
VLAGKLSPKAPVWLYRFTYVESVLRGRRTGADHGSEIPFVFDSSRAPFRTDQDKRVTAAMHGCWAAFAKTGTPSCPGVAPWPAYDPQAEMLMEFGDQIGPREVPGREALDLLTARLPSLGGRR